jgi:hypothetical protein
MTKSRIQLIDSSDGDAADVRKLSSVSIASFTSNFGYKITINKTWHANCRDHAVSKFLDWLVL